MVCKYDYEPLMVRSPTDDSYDRIFRVRLYCLFDGNITYSFFHQHIMLDHYNEALKRGCDVSCFVHSIIVTPFKFKNIFKEISDYVSRSNSD